MFLSRAAVLAAVVCLAACQSTTPVQLARPKAPNPAAMQQALNGTSYAGTATFNAPVVNPNTWNGSPIGTGSFSAQSTPPQSGGQQSIAADDASDPQQVVHYIIVGDLTGSPSSFFGVISLNAFAVGTATVDNVSTFAGIFDGATGEPTALATSGTVTFTAAGATVVGSFNGTLEDYTASPPPPPACRIDADCAASQVCVAGQCVAAPPPPPPPPSCTSNAQCAPNEVCTGGRCVQVVSGNCDGQGTGAYSGSAGAVATCSALGNGAFSLTNGAAFIGDDGSGQLGLFVIDPNSDANGVVIPLNGCPSAPGSVSVSGAQVYSQASGGTGLTLYALREAAGTVTFTALGAHRTGTFSLTLSSGGSLTGTFDVQ